MKTIDLSDLRAALAEENPPRLLEALPPKYFREGHLPGAKQLDHTNAAVHAKRLGIGHYDPIVIYCANEACKNSHSAANSLIAAGFIDVSVYVEGKKGWIDAGFDLEGTRTAA